MASPIDPSRALAIEYSAKAIAYAQHWSPVIRPMALPLFRDLPLSRARAVLDIGTGTGAMIPDLRAAAPEAVIIGVDRAEGMLRAARVRGRTSVAAMDAEHLGLRSSAFDVAVVVFVLFHLPDPVQSLREISRAVRRGGSIGIVIWGRDPGLPGLPIWIEELDREGAAPDPRDPSVMQQAQMDSEEKLRGIVEASGLDSVRVWSVISRHQWTLEALLAVQMGCGLAARRLPTLSHEAAARCESRVKARLSKLTEAELTHRPEVLFAVASRGA